MSLSEGKMFTIEALNRIEGFVWPKHASHAFMNEDERFVSFTSGRRPDVVVGVYKCMFTGIYAGSVSAGCKHQDWRNSLITREEFESVDGWVNINGQAASSMEDIIDVMLDGGLIVSGVTYSDALLRHQPFSKWRYSKPEPESIETIIRRYKAAGENKRTAIDKLNQAQADVEQAEALEDSLFMAIEAWAESHGFDIRVLSESDNVIVTDGLLSSPEYSVGHQIPEPVITDWRDLQVGDVIWWSVNCDSNGIECEVVKVANPESKDRLAVYVKLGGNYSWIDVCSEEWKFIRRPEKK